MVYDSDLLSLSLSPNLVKQNGYEYYDIIFMSFAMPFMGGTKSTRIIREMGYNLPIIGLSGNNVLDGKCNMG
jgi:CheY-like chemotaxis protein